VEIGLGDSALQPNVRGNPDTSELIVAHANKPCTCVERLEVYGHGGEGYQGIAGGSSNDREITKESAAADLGPVKWCKPCSVLFYGCSVGGGDAGDALAKAVTGTTGCRFEAYGGPGWVWPTPWGTFVDLLRGSRPMEWDSNGKRVLRGGGSPHAPWIGPYGPGPF
jgi:hypothetical protein